MTHATYRRARAAGIPARDALRIARWAAEPYPDVPDYGAPLDLPPREGFALRARVGHDEGFAPEDLGYGRVIWPVRWAEWPDRRPEPEALPLWDGLAWYVPAEPLAEWIAYARKRGASRSVALDEARKRAREERDRYQDEPAIMYLVVEASRAGVPLGSASLGGIELGWDPITRDNGARHLAEAIEDLIPEAIEDARVTLRELEVVPA